MRLDLVDEYRVTLFPYVAVKGRRLFDDLEKSRQLELVSGTAFGNGTLELAYRPRLRPDKPSTTNLETCADIARTSGALCCGWERQKLIGRYGQPA
jgi:hypothetical protein